jgi:hypothetical protein
LPEDLHTTDPMVSEYLDKAAAQASEVLDAFFIAGIPRLTPEQQEQGAMVNPVIRAEGNVHLLCFVAEQAAVELHRERLSAEDEEEETG